MTRGHQSFPTSQIAKPKQNNIYKNHKKSTKAITRTENREWKRNHDHDHCLCRSPAVQFSYLYH